jgi:GNAT superfamily N-acetyltransferase
VTSIAFTTEAADEAAIRSLLSAYNAEHGWGGDSPILFNVVLRDGDGAVGGGLIARTNWRWLWVITLALAPAMRGQGHGARLLAAAEQHARGLGCVGARVDTYSFQARGFYVKQGYGEAGRIPDCPPGHVRYTMFKRLVGAAER